LDRHDFYRSCHLFRSLALAGEVGYRALAWRYSVHVVRENYFLAVRIDNIAVNVDFPGRTPIEIKGGIDGHVAAFVLRSVLFVKGNA
jgi:hypothetical protein